MSDNISGEMEDRVADPLYDLEFETGEVITPYVFSEKEWHSKHAFSPLYENIKEEGRLL